VVGLTARRYGVSFDKGTAKRAIHMSVRGPRRMGRAGAAQVDAKSNEITAISRVTGPLGAQG